MPRLKVHGNRDYKNYLRVEPEMFQELLEKFRPRLTKLCGVWCGQDAVHSILQYGGQHHEAVWLMVCGVWCVVWSGCSTFNIAVLRAAP